MKPLYCLVCEENYFGRNDWLHHLSQESHQKLARQCFLMDEAKLDKNGRYQSCLVVFTLVPLTSQSASWEVLEYFSKLIGGDLGDALVTEFVWWTDRPYVGILQFESMDKVMEVLRALDVREGTHSLSKIRIGRRHHQAIHVKAGFQLAVLEWRGLLPTINSPPSSPPPPSHQTSFNDNPVVKEEPDSDNDDDNDTDTIDNHRLFKRVRLLEEEQPPQQDNCSADNANYTRHKPSRPPSARHSVPWSLQVEYQAIQKIMRIPDSQTSKISVAMASLKLTLSKLDPLFQAAPFRKGCLGLNYPPPLIPAADLRRHDGNDNQEDILAHVYTLGEHTAFEVDTKVKDYFDQNVTQFKLVKEYRDHLKLKHLPTNLRIILVTPKRKGCLVEVQICRLMEYLCQFDPRCHSLMTLACYWATLNGVNVNHVGNEDPDIEDSRNVPPQYTVQWLVLFFLSNKFFIPSVREVQEMNPVDFLKDEVTGENIGFLSDPGYVEKWRKLQMQSKINRNRKNYGHGIPVGGENSEEFMENVLRLFHTFLGGVGKFLGRKTTPWIFNTMDGVQISVSSFFNKDQSRWGAGGKGPKGSRWKDVRKEEVERLKGALMRDGGGEMMRRKDCGAIHMTHPFLWGEKIGLVEGEQLKIVSERFLEGARKLGGFFERVDKKGRDGGGGSVEVERALEMEGGLENLLKI